MPRSPLPLAAALAVLALAGCGSRPSAQELATEDYCRAAANRVFDAQHRDLLSEEDQSSSPFSSTGLPYVPDKGLSDQFIHENRVDDCISRRTAATEDGTTFGAAGSSPTASSPAAGH